MALPHASVLITFCRSLKKESELRDEIFLPSIVNGGESLATDKCREIVYLNYYLRTVLPFVTAHTFCASQAGPRNSGFLRPVPSS